MSEKKTTVLRQRMLEDLQLAGLSESTQNSYLRAVGKLAAYYHRSPDQLTEEQLRAYFLYLKNDKKYSCGALGIAHNGIKFFYSHTVVRDWVTLRNLRVIRQKKLPDVLAIDEVHRILQAVREPRYKAYLWTVYSLGLRRQEALALQLRDIDSARMLVHLHGGKRCKDRYVPLPARTLDVLRANWATHRHPQLLFPSRGKGTAHEPMSAASVHRALASVVLKMGLPRDRSRRGRRSIA